MLQPLLYVQGFTDDKTDEVCVPWSICTKRGQGSAVTRVKGELCPTHHKHVVKGAFLPFKSAAG